MTLAEAIDLATDCGGTYFGDGDERNDMGEALSVLADEVARLAARAS